MSTRKVYNQSNLKNRTSPLRKLSLDLKYCLFKIGSIFFLFQNSFYLGMLPLTFETSSDYDKIEPSDRISLVGLNELTPGKVGSLIFSRTNSYVFFKLYCKHR